MRKIMLFLVTILWIGGMGVKGQAYEYFVDFEGGETKGNYTTGNLILSGKIWELTEVLIGNLENDFKNGLRSARLRAWNGAAMTMLEDKNFGLGVLSFQYRRYGSDANQQPWAVEYSTDSGLTWTQVGSAITATDEVQVFSETLNIEGDVRIRIRLTTTPGTSGDRRMNIDDILLTDYASGGFASTALINFDNTAKWVAGSGGLNSYAVTHLYLDENWVFTGGPALRDGTSIQDGVPSALGAYSWRLQENAGTIWTATYNSRNTIASFGFKARRWDSDPEPIWEVDYSNDGGSSFLPAFSINNSSLDDSSEWKNFQYDLSVPVLVDQGEFIVRVSSISGERIMIDDFTYGIVECVNTDRQFRSVASGNWDNSLNWAYSDDSGVSWNPASCVPNANASSVTIQSNHVIVMEKNFTLRNAVIEPNATLEIMAGTLSFANSTGHALEIEPGGVLHFNGGRTPLFGSLATVLVRTGAMIRVSNQSSGISGILAGSGSSNRVFYENDAIFEWNTGVIFETNNQTYFPNAGNDIIPVFRTMANMGVVGSGNPTTFHGRFVANGNITWQNTGPKTFRNGITGTGTITQAATSGPFVISGPTAQLGGSGILQLNASGLQIDGDVVMSSNKIIADGPVTVSGTLDAGTFDLTIGDDLTVDTSGSLIMNEGKLILDGDASQTLMLHQPLVLSGLTVDNPAGITANQNITISNNLVMTEGIIDLGDNILTLGTSGTQSGHLEHDMGAITGKFRRWIPSAVSTEDILFPVGKGDRYVPVAVRFAVAPVAGTLTGEFISIIENPASYYGNLPIYDGSLQIDNLSNKGYWTITSGDDLDPAIYEIAVFPDIIMQEGLIYPDRARIVKRDDDFSDWGVAGSFSTGIKEEIRHNNITTGFSHFALGGNSQDNPLPVELLNFEVRFNVDNVNLNWSTATEINNDYFTIERSIDMKEIEPIGRVAGAGNSNRVLHYRFTDQNPLPGINYYRLKQSDFDETVDYSHWTAVQVDRKLAEELEIIRLYQQHDQVLLVVKTAEAAYLQIHVSDMFGREVYLTRLRAGNGLVRHAFAPGVSGVLIVTVADGKRRVAERVIFTPW